MGDLSSNNGNGRTIQEQRKENRQLLANNKIRIFYRFDKDVDREHHQLGNMKNW